MNISDRTFRNGRDEVMGSFTPDKLCQMYHLPKPEKLYDKAFLEHFTKENEDPLDATQTWRSGLGKFKHEKSGMYPIVSLSNPHNFVAMMMCRLFGKADSTNFFVE